MKYVHRPLIVEAVRCDTDNKPDFDGVAIEMGLEEFPLGSWLVKHRDFSISILTNDHFHKVYEEVGE